VTIPDGSGIKRIIRLSDAVDPTGMNRNLYMCTGCGGTQWGKDREPKHEAWREEHRQECFLQQPKPRLEVVPRKTKKKIELPLTEFISSFRMGGIPGISIKNPGAKRNIIVEYTYYD
jgi:hypothetical protein